MAATIIVVAALAAACSSAATAPPAASVAPSVPGVPPSAPASAASAPAASASSAAGGTTIMTATVGAQGTLIVAGSNGMTLYQFAKDTPNSGTSACTGTCITTWPPLTVPAGATPTAGSRATGKIGTITRPDDGSTQVTYNGLPLHFYSGDSAVGDANGIYTDWSAVKP